MKRLSFLFFSLLMAFSLSAQNSEDTARSSIAMLNYLATESMTIETAKENRVVLSEIRRKLENTTNPSSPDLRTQGYLNSLLQSLTSMSLSAIQRDKLQTGYLLYAG